MGVRAELPRTPGASALRDTQSIQRRVDSQRNGLRSMAGAKLAVDWSSFLVERWTWNRRTRRRKETFDISADQFGRNGSRCFHLRSMPSGLVHCTLQRIR
jgi:hypothetical protein